MCLLIAGVQSANGIEAGMPNPPSNPTKVKLGVFLADIIDMDEMEENFQIEMILVAKWDDPRLAYDAEAEGTDQKLFQGAFQFNEVYSAWWPQILIVNEVGTGDMNAVRITIKPSGEVTYMEQRNVTLETPMALKRFPFDVQTLDAIIIPFGEYSDQVEFDVDPNILEASEEFAEVDKRVNIAQWEFVDLTLKVDDSATAFLNQSKSISKAVLSITIKRVSTSIIWKVILPLVILVSLMWAVFWMDVTDLSDRLNISFIGILTIVAYQFLIDGEMPRISYFTFTDSVLLFSFLVMCCTIYESLIVCSLYRKGKEPLALRIDKIAQWLFPVVYLTGLMISYYYYLYLTKPA